MALAGVVVLLVAACGGTGAHLATGKSVDITKAPAGDGEVSAAVDPHDPNVLLAGSNGDFAFRMRAYTSVTGGARWSSSSLAVGSYGVCFSDPSVAIAADGRQYFAYMQIQCARFPVTGEIVLRTRARPTKTWSRPRRVALASGVLEDRPVVAVDSSAGSPHEGRVWVAWTSYVNEDIGGRPFIAHSDDDGQHWSTPVTAGPGGYEPTLVVANDGSLLEASIDFRRGAIVVSTPGAHGFTTAFVATRVPGAWCSVEPKAMPNRKVCMVPSVVLDRAHDLAYVAWSSLSTDGRRHVYVRRFDLAQLRRQNVAVRLPPRLAHTSADADQFLAAAAVDQQTGAVWVCYYDTQGDPTRRRVHFVCQESKSNGHSWTRIVASGRPSDETTTFASHFGYGDYEAVVAAAGEAHPFWTAWASRALLEDVFTTTLDEPR